MKHMTLLIILLTFSSLSIASTNGEEMGETNTECIQMKDERNNLKANLDSTKFKKRVKSSKQSSAQ